MKKPPPVPSPAEPPRTPETAANPHIKKVRETVAKARALRAESQRLIAKRAARKQ
jgi:hypothetical protein